MGHVLNLLVSETAVCNTYFFSNFLGWTSVKGGKFLNYPKDYSFFKKRIILLGVRYSSKFETPRGNFAPKKYCWLKHVVISTGKFFL